MGGAGRFRFFVNGPSSRETEVCSAGLACLATSGLCWFSGLASRGCAILGIAKEQVSIQAVKSAVGAPVLGNEEEEPRRCYRKAGELLSDWRAGKNASLKRQGVALIPTLGLCHLAMDGGWPLVPRGSSAFSSNSSSKWVKVHLSCVSGNSPSLCLSQAAVPIPRPSPAGQLSVQ